ncbi:MAG: hypothetical protein ACOH1P_10930 [Lysobacter sp.]
MVPESISISSGENFMKPTRYPVLALGVLAAASLSFTTAQGAQAAAATQDGSPAARSSMSVQERNVELVQRPLKLEARKLEPVAGQLTPPVITDPVSGPACCATEWGDKLKATTEFDVSGEGLPGHLVRVRANFTNGDSTTQIKNERVRVGSDGHWTVRRFKASTSDLVRGSQQIEINATQYIPATRVREPDGEAHAVPVILRFNEPRRRGPAGQAASSGG